MPPLDDTHTHAGSSPHDPFSAFNTDASPIMFPVVERAVAWQTRHGEHRGIATHKAIVRASPDLKDAIVLGVVGANFKLVLNKELFAHVEAVMRKEIPAHNLRGVMVKDSVARWGTTCYRQYIFPNIKCTLNNQARSQIAFRLIVQNGYGGLHSSALRVHAGAIDFYCTNGMVSGEYQSAYRKHTKGLVVSGFTDTIHSALDMFNQSQDKWNRWATTPVKHAAAMELFHQLTDSARLRENLCAQYLRECDARGHNMWAVYSTLTYYASHSDGEFALRSTVNDQDSVASTMLLRELSVAKWVTSDAWRALESA